MPKRFADSEIWTKPWYRRLSPAEKCAFMYLTTRCDNVGVWVPDFEAANFMIGEEIDWPGLLNKCNNNIKVLENGKWWLPDFCVFQYGDLQESTTNRAHQSYIRLLKKHGLWNGRAPTKGLGSPIHGAKDKDKEKEKDKDKEKEKNPRGKDGAYGTEAKACLDYYFEKHKEVRGFDPMIDGSRDMAIFKRILKADYTVDAVKQVIDFFFGYEKRSKFTTRALYDSFDTLYGVLRDKAEGKR